MEEQEEKILTKITKRLELAPSKGLSDNSYRSKDSSLRLTVPQAILFGSIIGALACYAVINTSNIKKHNDTQFVSTSSETGKGFELYKVLPDLPVTIEGVVPLPPHYENVHGI